MLRPQRPALSGPAARPPGTTKLSQGDLPVQIGIPRETHAGETRVAATPETVRKFVAQGHQVVVEAGAGRAACITDGDYEAAGARLADAGAALGAELVLKVVAPSPAELAQMRPGAVLVGMLNPF